MPGLRLHAPNRPHWRIEPLAGWHLPLLGDPAFLPLQAQLQRAALLGMPARMLGWLGGDRRQPPQVLVAFAEHSQTALGLVLSRPLNRSGSCWQVQHLRTTRADVRQQLSCDLLKTALARVNASSWVAAAACDDRVRLAVLRQLGFQPLRQDQLWCWQAPGPAPAQPEAPSSELQLRPLNRRTAGQLWHLEQTVCPAQLRQVLDRRVEDLLDQSQGQGWLLLDTSRGIAVAGLRWLGDHPGGGHDLELSVDPGWHHLYGPWCALLLHKMVQSLGSEQPLWLRCDPDDTDRQRWLLALQAQPRSERVLMARSIWRRQPLPNARNQTSRGIEAVLAQLQPRRRPVPTPLVRR